MFNTTRAIIFCTMAILLFALACSGTRNQSRNKLLIYTPHGQDMLRDFVARYKKAHPEVEVQFLDMGSREVLASVLSAIGRRRISGGARRTQHFSRRRTKIFWRHIDPRGPARSLTSPAMRRIAGTAHMKLRK